MIWLLLVIFQIKHFLADYPLQGKMMLGKFKPHPDYIMPLFMHCLVHGAFTWIIAMFFKPEHAVLIAALDGCIHFVVDRIKASPTMLGRFKAVSAGEMKEIIENEKYYKMFPGSTTTLNGKAVDDAKLRSNKFFWWCLGGDQMAHHLTHYVIIYLLIG